MKVVPNKISERLRGRYAVGPRLPNGEPEFGFREFKMEPCDKCAQLFPSPLDIEAAEYIDDLEARLSYLKRNPSGAAHLFSLLMQGKGDEAAFDKTLGRLMESESHILGRKQSEMNTDQAKSIADK